MNQNHANLSWYKLCFILITLRQLKVDYTFAPKLYQKFDLIGCLNRCTNFEQSNKRIDMWGK